MNKYTFLLSVIIVSWRAKDLTLQCLGSVYNSKDFNLLKDAIEIIVVDNGSKDGTIDAIKKKFPTVSLIENHKNIGYAPACNQGITKSKGKYILLLGNDTRVKDDAFLGNITFLEENSSVGAITVRLLNDDGSLQKGNCKRFPSLKDGLFTYLGLTSFTNVYQMSSFDYSKITEIEQAATTYLMIRGELLKNLGGFDEKYRILYNDVDLCQRIKNSGYKIIFNPKVEVYHKGSASTCLADPTLRLVMYVDIYRYYYYNYGIKALVLIPVLFIRYIAVLLFK
ncbi:MAG: glycosyltransferase family 2 protein [Ignavibacteria bacterium]